MKLCSDITTAGRPCRGVEWNNSGRCHAHYLRHARRQRMADVGLASVTDLLEYRAAKWRRLEDENRMAR